jgi:hypothetical protein
VVVITLGNIIVTGALIYIGLTLLNDVLEN